MFEALLRDWDGEVLAARFDEPTQSWFLIGVHSTALGPALGGTRMKTYDDPAAAVADVLRLSRAMTFKNAMAGLSFGGGKAVLAVPALPQGGARRVLFERYADLLGSLGGSYITACDMNTSQPDMDVIADRCSHVMGTSVDRGGSGTSAPDTAVGVYHGIRAALAHRFDDDGLEGRTVIVQGAGAVGSVLAELLAEGGGTVVITDVDPARAQAVAARSGAAPAEAGSEYDIACDVFAPCATGGTLDEKAIAQLRCAIVAGAANNQLAEPEDAGRLAAAGILYAPDYVVNAGGVLHLAGYERLGWSAEEVEARLRGIGETLAMVFADASESGITPSEAADKIAMERIDATTRVP